MRTRDLDRLDRRLELLLARDRQMGPSWHPSRNIAQALAAVEQAGLRVNTLSDMYGQGIMPIDDGWYCRLNTPERDYMGDAYADTHAAAVTMALIAALEGAKK